MTALRRSYYYYYQSFSCEKTDTQKGPVTDMPEITQLELSDPVFATTCPQEGVLACSIKELMQSGVSLPAGTLSPKLNEDAPYCPLASPTGCVPNRSRRTGGCDSEEWERLGTVGGGLGRRHLPNKGALCLLDRGWECHTALRVDDLLV